METLAGPTQILLEELPEKFHIFDFLVDHTKTKLRTELELSLKASEIVGKLYDALRRQYINPDNETSLVSLNKLCVRLVFCLYAESATIFGKHKIFRDWLEGSRNIRQDLILMFDVLNTPLAERDPYLDDTLKKFPFVNGGLFSGAIEIPNLTPDIKNLLLDEASSGFNWAGISPTIFGAVFESTLNPITRRTGGMHYTSLENIHKVIDPLFLNDLRDELRQIKTSARNRKKKLLAFQDKLAAIKIFDPACGSGNFLTESYPSLRRLENDVLKELFVGTANPLKRRTSTALSSASAPRPTTSLKLSSTATRKSSRKISTPISLTRKIFSLRADRHTFKTSFPLSVSATNLSTMATIFSLSTK